VIAVRDRRNDFGDSPVVVITFVAPPDLARYRAHLDLPFTLLADLDRAVYRQFGLGRGALHRVWNPGTLRLYGSLLAKGRRLRRPTHDTRQLGGDFVIDRHGRLAAGFWPASPDDRPSVDDLLTALTDANGVGPLH
jgi:peroxiredoxin